MLVMNKTGLNFTTLKDELLPFALRNSIVAKECGQHRRLLGILEYLEYAHLSISFESRNWKAPMYQKFTTIIHQKKRLIGVQLFARINKKKAYQQEIYLQSNCRRPLDQEMGRQLRSGEYKNIIVLPC